MAEKTFNLLHGISNFEKLILENYVFVDKASEKSLAHSGDAQNQLQNNSSSAIMKDRKDVKNAVILFIGKNKYE